MDERASEVSEHGGRNQITFLVVAAILVGSFLWRVVTPAHEYPMRSEQVLTMVLDLLLVAGLVGLKQQVVGLGVLFWIALAAGVGLFAIRLNGDASWWTGHLSYYILPR